MRSRPQRKVDETGNTAGRDSMNDAKDDDYPCEIRLKEEGDELLGIFREAGEPSPAESIDGLVKRTSDEALTRLWAGGGIMLCTPLTNWQ